MDPNRSTVTPVRVQSQIDATIPVIGAEFATPQVSPSQFYDGSWDSFSKGLLSFAQAGVAINEARAQQINMDTSVMARQQEADREHARDIERAKAKNEDNDRLAVSRALDEISLRYPGDPDNVLTAQRSLLLEWKGKSQPEAMILNAMVPQSERKASQEEETARKLNSARIQGVVKAIAGSELQRFGTDIGYMAAAASDPNFYKNQEARLTGLVEKELKSRTGNEIDSIDRASIMQAVSSELDNYRGAMVSYVNGLRAEGDAAIVNTTLANIKAENATDYMKQYVAAVRDPNLHGQLPSQSSAEIDAGQSAMKWAASYVNPGLSPIELYKTKSGYLNELVGKVPEAQLNVVRTAVRKQMEADVSSAITATIETTGRQEIRSATRMGIPLNADGGFYRSLQIIPEAGRNQYIDELTNSIVGVPETAEDKAMWSGVRAELANSYARGGRDYETKNERMMQTQMNYEAWLRGDLTADTAKAYESSLVRRWLNDPAADETSVAQVSADLSRVAINGDIPDDMATDLVTMISRGGDRDVRKAHVIFDRLNVSGSTNIYSSLAKKDRGTALAAVMADTLIDIGQAPTSLPEFYRKNRDISAKFDEFISAAPARWNDQDRKFTGGFTQIDATLMPRLAEKMGISPDQLTISQADISKLRALTVWNSQFVEGGSLEKGAEMVSESMQKWGIRLVNDSGIGRLVQDANRYLPDDSTMSNTASMEQMFRNAIAAGRPALKEQMTKLYENQVNSAYAQLAAQLGHPVTEEENARLLRRAESESKSLDWIKPDGSLNQDWLNNLQFRFDYSSPYAAVNRDAGGGIPVNLFIRTPDGVKQIHTLDEFGIPILKFDARTLTPSGPQYEIQKYGTPEEPKPNEIGSVMPFRIPL